MKNSGGGVRMGTFYVNGQQAAPKETRQVYNLFQDLWNNPVKKGEKCAKVYKKYTRHL